MPMTPRNLTVEFNIDAMPALEVVTAMLPDWNPRLCPSCGQIVQVHRDILATWERCLDCRTANSGPNPYVNSAPQGSA